MFLEILSVLILLSLLLIAYRLHKKQPEDTGNAAFYGDIKTQLGTLAERLEQTEKRWNEEKDKREKEMKDEREKNESKLNDMLRIMAGTQKRGKSGEEQLKNILSVPLRIGQIIPDLQIGSQKVEFAWKLGNGKHIPIDSKFPEVEELCKEYEESEDPREQKKLKNEIIRKIRTRASEAAKNKTKPGTIAKVIVAIPDALIDMVHDINAGFKNSGIFICGYSYVFFFGYYLSEAYMRTLESGDIGGYYHCIDELHSIMKTIQERTENITRGVKMIDKANKEIVTQTFEAERHRAPAKKKG